MSTSTCGLKNAPNRLENIEEEGPVNWLPATCPAPETPTESMEFLARSWSLSAMELSKALGHTHLASTLTDKSSSKCSSQGAEVPIPSSAPPKETKHETLFHADRSPPPASPRASEEFKELFPLNQAVNRDFISNPQLLKNAHIYRSIIRRRTVGRWLKDQKEKKKQELRAHNARLHAAISVAGVAAAVAALTATSLSEKAAPSKTSATIASAAALVASHCIEIAEEMGAEHEQILSVVGSAISARTNGDVMALTAGAATALRGAATLKARLQGAHGNGTTSLTDERFEEAQDSTLVMAMNFVSSGGELLKRTRKGVVSGVCSDIPAWSEGEWEDGTEQRAYFGIKTEDRVIEFECRNKRDKEMWIKGIQHMLNCRDMF